MNRSARLRGALVCLLLAVSARAGEAVWQWSAPFGEGRAFLWIPEDCRRVRALVLAQHNMLEQGILEHPAMRRTLAELGCAAVFIAPPFDPVFHFERGAGERIERLLHTLATDSGYAELASAPVVPLGHSACASFPWNFAAWAPERTLAILSVKGDAPQTGLTGSGAANPDWGERRIDGIPGLMVMSEQEWWEERLAPLLRFRAAHPAVPLAVLCDTGRGHFDASDELVAFLGLFLGQAAAARLPAEEGAPLRPVNPAVGWLAARWHADRAVASAPVPAAGGEAPGDEFFWCFDEEMARATSAYQARGGGQKAQQVDFVQDGRPVPISTAHSGVELAFLPEADGLTFRLSADFIAPFPKNAPVAAKDNHQQPPPTTVQPVLTPPDAHAVAPVRITPIVGPVEQIGPDVFRVAFDRTFSTNDKRARDIWLVASHPGDATFRAAVQQARLRVPECTAGASQTILFPALADQPVGLRSVALRATASSGLPVGYYVREGPAWVRDGVLHLAPLPPRAKLPVRVTVLAWQAGCTGQPAWRAATPVERSFLVYKPE